MKDGWDSTFDIKVLGSLESSVMALVWGAIHPMNVKEVLHGLDRELAYTTVMTTLDRLHRKGLVTRAKDGQAYRYVSAMSRSQFHQRLLEGVMGSLLSHSAEAVLGAFVELAARADKANLEILAQLVAERLRESEALGACQT